MDPLLLAVGIGLVSGLRTFTSLAAVMLVRGGLWGYVLTVVAAGEYVADLSPKIPARTGFPSNVARAISGALAGWLLATMHGGAPVAGCAAGIVGAAIGTYGGHAARAAAIARIGALPAALLEDALAIALAALIVTR